MYNARTFARPWVFGVMLCCLWSVVGLAHHNGPEFYVDARNPVEDDLDGDYHFRTIAAALSQFPLPTEDDTIIVAPGVYEGSVNISVDGLTLRASGSADQTIIKGSIVIDAERVTFRGFTVDATDQAVGVHVLGDAAVVEDVSVFGAGAGVSLSGPRPLKRIQLKNSRIYNNEIGIQASDLRDSLLTDNLIDANSAHGGLLEHTYEVALKQNQWTLNGGTGLWLKDGRYLTVEADAWLSNGDHGIVLEAVSRVSLTSGRAHQNGGFGLWINDAHLNRVEGSSFDRNARGGVMIDHGSQANVVQNSAFLAHSAGDGAGAWLEGSVHNNEIIGNSFELNRVGVWLTATRQGAPGSNRIQQNTVTQSSGDGIRAEGSEGDNVVEGNTLTHNNGNGVYWAGGRDRLVGNDVQHSGQTGFYLDAVSDMSVLGNVVRFSQADGLALAPGAANNRIQDNELSENFGGGVRLSADQDTRLVANTLFGNQRHGLWLQRSQRVTVEANALRHNGEWGVWMEQIAEAKVLGNQVTQNNAGGIALDQADAVLLENNTIETNLHLGARATGSPVDARRNWWGHPLGPAGLFEGRGNAVWGIPMSGLLPWLPDRPDALLAPTVEALILDAVGGGQTLEIDARDRSNLQIQLTELGQDADGRRVPVSQGVVLLAEYDVASRLPFEIPSQTKALHTVQLGGVSYGQAHLTLSYDGLEVANPSGLGLYLRTTGGWEALPGRVWPQSRQVTGELASAALKPAVIALVEGEVEAALLAPQTQSDTGALGANNRDNLPTAVRALKLGIDLSLIGVFLVLVGLGRAARTHRWLERLKATLL